MSGCKWEWGGDKVILVSGIGGGGIGRGEGMGGDECVNTHHFYHF